MDQRTLYLVRLSCVFIIQEHLSRKTSEKDIETLFTGFAIDQVCLPPHEWLKYHNKRETRTIQCPGFCFVTFDSVNTMEKALAFIQGLYLPLTLENLEALTQKPSHTNLRAMSK
jgi:RNA recognition motif-containing protein